MRPFPLFVRLRLRDAVGRPGRALAHLGLPALLLFLSGALFFAGRPFERRVVAVVGDAPLAARDDLRIEPAATREAGLARLRAGAAQAVLAGGVLAVGPREELFGRGLAALVGARLEVVAVPPHAYLRYLFPGLVTWTVLVNGLLGMGYNMARYRRTQFLKKLSLTPLSPYTFVLAQITARVLLSLGQLAVLAACAALLFDLPLGPLEAGWLALVTTLGLVVFCGAGFALAAALESEVTSMDVANALTAVLLLVSGVFFPVADLPRPVAAVAELLPSTQLVHLLREGFSTAGLALLGAWALATYLVSVLRFRW